MKRLLSIILLSILTVALTAQAFAAGSVASIEFETGYYGGNYDVFYVKTGNIFVRKLELSMTKGTYTLETFRDFSLTQDAYGCYDINTYYKSGNNWVYEKTITAGNVPSLEVSFNRNDAVNKVEIISWNSGEGCAAFFATNYRPFGWSKDISGISEELCRSDGVWLVSPRITAKPIWGCGCTLYTEQP